MIIHRYEQLPLWSRGRSINNDSPDDEEDETNLGKLLPHIPIEMPLEENNMQLEKLSCEWECSAFVVDIPVDSARQRIVGKECAGKIALKKRTPIK